MADSHYYGGNKVTELEIDLLKLGVLGTAVTATATEINSLTSSGVANADLIKLHAITESASNINLLVTGVAAGYKIAYGTAAVGAASVDVVTGLTTVIGAVVSLVGDPSLTHMSSTVTVGDQAVAPIAGSIRIKSWKPTASGDVTPIAATSTFANVAWVAIGT